MSDQTKKLLAESFVSLIMKKPVDKITIKDITKNCDVSRMTFYYHFKDVYDLFDWVSEEAVRQIFESDPTPENWMNQISEMAKRVPEVLPYLKKLYRSSYRSYIEKHLEKQTYVFIRKIIDQTSEGMAVSEESKDYIARFYRHGCIGILFDWADNDMKEDAMSVVNKGYTLLSDTKTVLKRFEAKDLSTLR